MRRKRNLQLQTHPIAMEIGGQWEMLDIAQTPGLSYGVGVPPRYHKPYTTSLGGATVIFKSTKHLQESLELIQPPQWMPRPWIREASPAHGTRYRPPGISRTR